MQDSLCSLLLSDDSSVKTVVSHCHLSGSAKHNVPDHVGCLHFCAAWEKKGRMFQADFPYAQENDLFRLKCVAHENSSRSYFDK